MLKVLVVDDEPTQREGLRSRVRWEKLGLKLIGAFPNGQVALEATTLEMPDILITDVRMPGMSGLELAAKLRARNPRLETVIISGYDEFEYANEAIRLQARAYVLKPFGSAKIEEILREIAGALRKDEQRRAEETFLRRQMRKTLPLLRERFLLDLCLRGCTGPKAARQASFLGLPREATMAVAILHMEPAGHEDTDEETHQLNLLRLRQLLERHVPPRALGVCTQQGERSLWLLLFLAEGEDYAQTITTWFENLRRDLADHTGEGLTAGVGDPVTGWEGIRRSYLEARRALRHRLVIGIGQTIFARDLAETNGQPLLDVEAYTEHLLDSLRSGTVDQVSAVIGGIFTAVEESMPTVQYLRSVCLELLAACRRVLHEEGVSWPMEAFFSENLVRLTYLETIPELHTWLAEIVGRMAEMLVRRRRHRSAALADHVRTYVQAHFAEDISIHTVAREVYLTPNYLGTVFRLEQGETFTDYLNRIRIEAAKELLRTRLDLKVYQVAELVGFKNVGYFFHLFRRLVGLPPGAYQTRKS